MSTISAGTTSTTALVSSGDTTGNLVFQTNGTTTAMTINTSQNVGIGTSSPSGRLHVANTSNTGTSADNCGAFVTSTNRVGFLWLDGAAASSTSAVFANAGVEKGRIIYYNSLNALAFQTNGTTEQMRIDSSGNLGLGVTPSAWRTSASANEKALQIGPWLSLYSDSGVTAELASNVYINSSNQYIYQSTGFSTRYRQYLGQHIWFTAPSGTAGNTISFTQAMTLTAGGELYIAGTTDQGAYNLQVNGTGVWGAGAYVNGSDARLKENIQTLTDGLSVVTQLRPVTFQYKADYSKDTSVQPGFIAQELQAVLQGKDYVDGVVQAGPEHLNVAYQTLIPVLTKAIQEQQTIIEDLRARIAVLEAK